MSLISDMLGSVYLQIIVYFLTLYPVKQMSKTSCYLTEAIYKYSEINYTQKYICNLIYDYFYPVKCLKKRLSLVKISHTFPRQQNNNDTKPESLGSEPNSIWNISLGPRVSSSSC